MSWSVTWTVDRKRRNPVNRHLSKQTDDGDIGLPFGMEVQCIHDHRDAEKRRQNATRSQNGERTKEMIEHQRRVSTQIAQARSHIATKQKPRALTRCENSQPGGEQRRGALLAQAFQASTQRPYLGPMQRAFAAHLEMQRHAFVLLLPSVPAE